MKLIIFFGILLCTSLLSLAQPSPVATDIVFGQSFIPDYTFKGNSLKGTHVVGQADWKAQNGELIGTAKQGSNGGWLFLDSPYQDVGFHAVFKGTANNETGILFRAEKTAKGITGILLSLKKGDVTPYRVMLDSEGKELEREKLRYAGGINYRLAPPPDTVRRGNFPPRPVVDVPLPVTRPNTDLRADDWNQIEVFLELNVIRNFLNDGSEIGGAIDGDSAIYGYGPIALFVGGTGEVRFKDIMLKDIAVRNTPKEKLSPRFAVQQISDMYYSWGADAADFNKDGFMDVVAGPYIYFGPDFTRHREIFPAIAVGPSKEFTRTHIQFTFDFDGDGWPDIIPARR